ncbi:uncharacterized [Tachysurus ichikawai]
MGADTQCWVKIKESEGKEIFRCGLRPGHEPDTEEREREMDESRRPGCSKAKWRQGEINGEQIYNRKNINEF